jgi:transcriptional regulator with XRE-family HTH domain
MKFGEFFRLKRLQNKMTLRGYCERYGQDPANVSKLENSKLNRPKNEEKLKALAISLDIKENSRDWVTFFDLAFQENKDLPSDIKDAVPQIISLLPAFLRTGDNKKINKEKVNELIKFLEKGGE